MSETKFRESHLDRKIKQTITALLNDMTPSAYNTDEEDVSLPEVIDRIVSKIDDVETRVEIMDPTGDTTLLQNKIKQSHIQVSEDQPNFACSWFKPNQ